jgi:hypothetical protein
VRIFQVVAVEVEVVEVEVVEVEVVEVEVVEVEVDLQVMVDLQLIIQGLFQVMVDLQAAYQTPYHPYLSQHFPAHHRQSQ